jgi:hypothetical protein
VAIALTLEAAPFSDSDAGDTHAASQWVVIRKADSIVVFNSGEDPLNKTSILVGALDPNTGYVCKVRYRDSRGVWSAYSTPVEFITEPIAPNLLATIVNDGSAQRSQVKSLTLSFDQPVILAAGAVRQELLNTGGSGANDGSAPTDASAALATPTTPDNGKTWVFTFAADSPFVQKTGAGASTGSLVDGIYRLSIDPAKVTANGVAMSAAPATFTFHRLFGDVNGSKDVNNADFGQFRNTFLRSTGDAAYNPAFDFDNNGSVNNIDFGQFRSRYGKVFAY